MAGIGFTIATTPLAVEILFYAFSIAICANITTITNPLVINSWAIDTRTLLLTTITGQAHLMLTNWPTGHSILSAKV